MGSRVPPIRICRPWLNSKSPLSRAERRWLRRRAFGRARLWPPSESVTRAPIFELTLGIERRGSDSPRNPTPRQQEFALMTSTTAAYLAVNQNLARYQTMTAAEPAVKSATAYYEANIGNATSIQAFVGNYRLLSYATQRLRPGRSNQQHRADHPGSGGRRRQFEEPRQHAVRRELEGLCGCVQLRRCGRLRQSPRRARSKRRRPTTSSSSSKATRGSDNVGVQLALYFQRVAPTVTSEYGILADPNLLEVAQTIFGLSADASASSIASQAQTLSRRCR